MNSARRIVAVGGGGFLLDDASLAQERYIVSLCKSPKPKVVYLGTAGGDSHLSRLKFMEAYTRLNCTPQTLAFFPYDMKADYARIVREADLIYVGGGNTVAMVAVWREFGFDKALCDAYQQGTVLAGISAGANCWFKHYITDSVPGGGVRDGLGWIDATFCPHLDSEAWRQAVLSAQPMPRYGAGENVVMLFENEQYVETKAFTQKPWLAVVNDKTLKNA